MIGDLASRVIEVVTDEVGKHLSLEQMMTPEDITKAFQVSQSTVTRWIRQGRFPVFKDQGTIRIRPSDVKSYIDKQMA